MNTFRIVRAILVLSMGMGSLTRVVAEQPAAKPNVLMIAIDDLNDWIGCLGGHPQTLEPAIRPLSLPRGGPWQYVETDWGALKATDEDYGGDQWVTSSKPRLPG